MADGKCTHVRDKSQDFGYLVIWLFPPSVSSNRVIVFSDSTYRQSHKMMLLINIVTENIVVQRMMIKDKR